MAPKHRILPRWLHVLIANLTVILLGASVAAAASYGLRLLGY